jgi:hypothetical protein
VNNEVVDSASGEPGFNGETRFAVGGRTSSSTQQVFEGSTIDIFEVLVFERALTAEELGALWGPLSSKIAATT